jgi:PPM family protein phosphatase
MERSTPALKGIRPSDDNVAAGESILSRLRAIGQPLPASGIFVGDGDALVNRSASCQNHFLLVVSASFGESGRKVKSHCISDRGRQRAKNEDSVFVDEVLGLFVVADGMGGHSAGEVASLIAVEQIASHVKDAFVPGEDPVPVMLASIRKANEAILRAASSMPQWESMGTTVVMALFDDQRVFVCHVGDSRAYLVRGGNISPLTKDHTLIEEWVDQGIVPREQARTHGARHGLTRALGMLDDADPETTRVDWTEGEALLLCSDGLTEVLTDPEIMEIIETFTDPTDASRALVRRANEGGGPDNISVIVVR